MKALGRGCPDHLDLAPADRAGRDGRPVVPADARGRRLGDAARAAGGLRRAGHRDRADLGDAGDLAGGRRLAATAPAPRPLSSVELEGAVLAHRAVREAAVVGIPSVKWDERPAVVVALCDGASLELPELHEFLTGRVARWWLPDELVVVDEVPKTSVGKYDKKAIRAQLGDRVLP